MKIYLNLNDLVIFIQNLRFRQRTFSRLYLFLKLSIHLSVSEKLTVSYQMLNSVESKNNGDNQEINFVSESWLSSQPVNLSVSVYILVDLETWQTKRKILWRIYHVYGGWDTTTYNWTYTAWFRTGRSLPKRVSWCRVVSTNKKWDNNFFTNCLNLVLK